MKNMQRYKTTLSLAEIPHWCLCDLSSLPRSGQYTSGWSCRRFNQSSPHPNLDSSFDWLKQIFSCRTTNQKLYLVATHLKYGISALFYQTSFREESSCGNSKCRPFSQAIKHVSSVGVTIIMRLIGPMRQFISNNYRCTFSETVILPPWSKCLRELRFRRSCRKIKTYT